MNKFDWSERYKAFCRGELTQQLVGDVMFLHPLADDGFGNLIARSLHFNLDWCYGWGSGL